MDFDTPYDYVEPKKVSPPPQQNNYIEEGLLNIKCDDVTHKLTLDQNKTLLEIALNEKIDVPYSFANRRSGDVPSIVADNKLALKTLNWFPKRDLSEMCKDGWKWQINNPNGYN